MSNTPSPVEHILGSHISVVSHNGMPYEGRLHNVSLDDKSGVMQHAQCQGTESRGEGHAAPSSDSLYEYIVFKTGDINDLHIHEPSTSSKGTSPALSASSATPSFSPVQQGVASGNSVSPATSVRSEASVIETLPSHALLPEPAGIMYPPHQPPTDGIGVGIHGVSGTGSNAGSSLNPGNGARVMVNGGTGTNLSNSGVNNSPSPSASSSSSTPTMTATSPAFLMGAPPFHPQFLSNVATSTSSSASLLPPPAAGAVAAAAAVVGNHESDRSMMQAHHDHLQSSGVSSVSRSSPLLASSAVNGLMEDGEDGQQLPGPAGGSPAHQPVEAMMGMATTMAASHAVTVSSASSSSAMSGVSMGSHGISPAAAAAAAAAAAMPRGPHMQHAFQPSAAPLGSLDPNAQMNGGNMMQQQQHVRMPLQQQQQPQQQMAFHPAHQYAHHGMRAPMNSAYYMRSMYGGQTGNFTGVPMGPDYGPGPAAYYPPHMAPDRAFQQGNHHHQHMPNTFAPPAGFVGHPGLYDPSAANTFGMGGRGQHRTPTQPYGMPHRGRDSRTPPSHLYNPNMNPGHMPAGVVPLPVQQTQPSDDVNKLNEVFGNLGIKGRASPNHTGANVGNDQNVPPGGVLTANGAGIAAPNATVVPQVNGVLGLGKQPLDPNAMAYASIIKSYASVGDEGGAEDVLRRLKEKSIKPDVVMYNALLSAYATNGNWQGAEEVLGRMASEGMLVQPNVVTYSSLINAYANKGNSDGAESVLSRMQSRGVDPNVITYNSVISAYAKEGNWQGANDVLRRMLQNQNVEPNVTTYNAVINAYANKGHWQGAEDVLHRMNAHNIQPNMTTYNSLIDAYANKGNWEGAEDVLRRMNRIKEMEPNVITYSSVINAYANKGNWQGAENVLRRMQYQGVQPNIITYNSLITAYAKEGNWQGAEDVLRRIHADPHVEPNVTTYNLVINAYANKGHWKGAEDMLQRLLSSKIDPNVMTYNSLINAHAKDGNWEGAEDVMRRLLERGIDPNVTTYNSIIKAYTKDGNSDGAEDVLHRMQEQCLKANVTTWSSVINAYATKGDWQGAEDVLRRMQEHRVEPNVTTYSSVINAYANKGHWAGAEDVLHRMEVKGLEPDVITYNSLLKVYSNARDVDGCGRGLDLIRQMIERRHKPTHVTFKTLFTLLLKHPDPYKLQAALMLLNDHLPVRSRNSPIYAPLIELCGVTGNMDAAVHYLEEARRGGHVDKFVLRAARNAGLVVEAGREEANLRKPSGGYHTSHKYLKGL